MERSSVVSGCLVVLGAVGCAVVGTDGSGAVDPDVRAAMNVINPAAIRAHLGFLADDLTEGRGPGTRGYRIAANYVAAMFEMLGLEPAGADDSYLQPVPLRAVQIQPDSSSLSLVRGGRSQPLRYAEDYLMDGWAANNFAEPETSVSGPVVYVGHGVTAPEHDYDDYAGVDVEGKIVAVTVFTAPSSFPITEQAYYSWWDKKASNAAAHGAVGMLFLMNRKWSGQISWDNAVRQFAMGSMCWLDPDGNPKTGKGIVPEIRARVMLSPTGAEKLFAGAPHSLDEVFDAAENGEPLSFELPVEVAIHTVTRHRRQDCVNVAAVLRGSDPVLENEYVVYTAHLDHLGIGDPVNGDAIYNGAVDNASGTAAMLEVARAFAALPEPPRRSVLFVAVTAEEKGLLGSDYFANHPTVPADAIVAGINMDGAMVAHELHDVIVYGGAHTTLIGAVEKATDMLGITISPDPAPEENSFVRSDQYSFVRQGIPAVAVVGGLETGDPDLDGLAQAMEWVKTTYHMPSDDLNQDFRYGGAVADARLQFLIGQIVADDPGRPRWNDGDFFGRIYGGR